MTKLSCGPLWKENNKWENVGLCYILSTQLTEGLRAPVTPLYGVQGSAPENFGFGPYVRLGGPTYGFVHDFRTCFLDAMVFGPWYWMLRHV